MKLKKQNGEDKYFSNKKDKIKMYFNSLIILILTEYIFCQ